MNNTLNLITRSYIRYQTKPSMYYQHYTTKNRIQTRIKNKNGQRFHAFFKQHDCIKQLNIKESSPSPKQETERRAKQDGQ